MKTGSKQVLHIILSVVLLLATLLQTQVPAFADDPLPPKIAKPDANAKSFLLKRYMDWQKQIKENGEEIPDSVKNSIKDFLTGELQAKIEEFRFKFGLTDAEMDQALEATIARFLTLVSPFLSDEEWCQRYEAFRGGKKSKYSGSKSTEWKQPDELAKTRCKKKSKKADDEFGGLFKECPPGTQSIQHCSNSNNYKIELAGDGVSTSSATVYVTNNETGEIGVGTGEFLCVSTRNHLPPPSFDVGRARSLTYQIAEPEPEDVAIVKAGDRLARTGAYNKSGLTDARHQIIQGATWMRKGEATKDKGDDYTKKRFKRDLFEKSNIDEKSMSTEARQKVDERVDTIFELFDLTRKEAEKPAPEKPEEQSPQTPDTPMTSTETPETPGTTATVQEGSDGTGDPVDETSDSCRKFCIPPGTVFDPSSPDYQKMMILNALPIVMIQLLDATGELTTGKPAPGEFVQDERPTPCKWVLERTLVYPGTPGNEKKARVAVQKVIDGTYSSDILVNEGFTEIKDLDVGENKRTNVSVYLIAKCVDERGTIYREAKKLVDKESVFWALDKSARSATRQQIVNQWLKSLKPCCKT